MWDPRFDSDLAKQLVVWRRTFHKFPEVSNHEKQTSLAVAAALQNMGIEAQTFADHFGVCGIIRGKVPGPTVVFRTDMDALPITEANDVSYRSTCEGVMHACGHDGHMAIALGVAKMFSLCRSTMAGNIKVLFQPAEEAAPVGGANLLIQSGVLDDAAVIFALHLWPDLLCGQIGIHPGPMMAASDRFTIRILGKGAHAGQPHRGVDSIAIAADVIQGMGHIMNRRIDPLETATLSIGTIQGGERYNVVAREVTMEGTVRTLNENVRTDIPDKVKNLLEGVTASQGGTYALDYRYGYPVLSNGAKPTELVIQAAKEILGDSAVHSDLKPVLAAEDFGRYLAKIPGAYFWLGCASEGKPRYNLHNPSFDIDEAALLIGVKIMYQTGLAALAHYSKVV
ncbi:MAG: amidohydrolase [Veillonellales bacterium]